MENHSNRLSYDIYRQFRMEHWIVESYYSTIDITLTFIIYLIVFICEFDIADFGIAMS